MNADLNLTRLQMLGELAEMGLVLARDLQQAALASEDMAEKARLADAFHRTGRGVRQSLALHARLEREASRAIREDAAQVVSLAYARRNRRKAQVKGAVERLIWTEYETDDSDAQALSDRLDALLDAEAEAEDFLDADPDVQIARLCEVLRMTPPNSPPHCGEGAGRGGVSADRARHSAPGQGSPQIHHEHPHPNPSPQGGGAQAPPLRPSG